LQLSEVLTEHAVLVVSGFELAPRPGIFTVLDLLKMDVPLIGCELTGLPDSGQRLVGWCCCWEAPIPSAPCPAP